MKMNKTILYAITAILFLSTFATAQFPKIKIPTVNTPKLPKLDKMIPSSVGMSGGKNRQMVIDDGYTFFEARPIEEYNAQYRGQIAKGWTMVAHLRAFGTFPKNSGFNVVIGKNGKALGKVFCEAKTYRKAEDDTPNAKSAPDDDYMMTSPHDGCYDLKKFVAESGNFDVQVFAVNGETDEEKLLRTYKIDVKEAKKIRPGNIPGVTDFFIQRHAEAVASFLYLRPDGDSRSIKHNYQNRGGGNTLKGNVDIYFNVAITRSAIEFSGVPIVRCSVNGERLKFENNGEINQASVRGDTVKWERDGKPTQYLGFYQYWINLPILWKHRGQSPNPNMEQKAGNWECELRNKNETIRKFKWTVGSDGFPVEHSEQKSGNINLHWGAYLIETEIPAGENSIEERLISLPNAGLFYGIPWKSEEGKKMAASVPKIGETYFVP